MCDVAWPSSTSNRRLQDSVLLATCDGRTRHGASMDGAYHTCIMDGTRYYVVWRGSTSIDKSIDRPAMDRMNGWMERMNDRRI